MLSRNERRQWAYFGLLALVFSTTLIRLAVLGWKVDLHSHVLLIPFISGYLVWIRREREIGGGSREAGDGRRETEDGASGDLPSTVLRAPSNVAPSPISYLPSPRAAGAFGLFGLVFAILGFGGAAAAAADVLALRVAALICLIVAGLCWFRGVELVRRHGFALAFLVFMIPMPTAVERGLEVFFQGASAEASYGLFRMVGVTVLRSGRVFELPGLTIEVAQECSGIRSSYVLFMVSLLAGHLLLRCARNRWLLAAFVVPLGILRNGFRILTISWLTIHVDPGVIHGPLHHRGGPIFFLLSLVPFFALVWWMRRREMGDRR